MSENPPGWNPKAFSDAFYRKHFNHEEGWFTPHGLPLSEVIHFALIAFYPISYHLASTLCEGYLLTPKEWLDAHHANT